MNRASRPGLHPRTCGRGSGGPPLAVSVGMRLLLILACLVLPACFLTHPIEKPNVTVTGVAVSSVMFTGIEGTIDLDVQNPNSFGVPLSLIEWELSVGGAHAVSGRIELSQTIPAKGIAPVTAALRIGMADAVAVAAEISGGTRDYTLSARFTFTSSFGSVTVDVVHQGELL